MQNVFRRVRQIQLALSRRHDSLLLQGVGPLDAYKPVYDRKPPWSARWTYPIIFAQIGVRYVLSSCILAQQVLILPSCALTELIVHHWTELKEPAEGADTPGSIQASDGDKATGPEYVLRPLWQRAAAAFAQFGLGAFVCVLLLNSRSRIVRRLYLLPSSAVTQTALSPKLPKSNRGGEVLVAQNVYHFRGQGNVFPFSQTQLARGFDQSEVAFEVPGVRGKYYLGLEDAKINGELQPLWQTREALFRLWYGAKGKKEMSKFGWVA